MKIRPFTAVKAKLPPTRTPENPPRRRGGKPAGWCKGLAEQMRAYRIKRGWSLVRMSEELGYSPQHISALEGSRYQFSQAFLMAWWEFVRREKEWYDRRVA